MWNYCGWMMCESVCMCGCHTGMWDYFGWVLYDSVCMYSCHTVQMGVVDCGCMCSCHTGVWDSVDVFDSVHMCGCHTGVWDSVDVFDSVHMCGCHTEVWNSVDVFDSVHMCGCHTRVWNSVDEYCLTVCVYIVTQKSGVLWNDGVWQCVYVQLLLRNVGYCKRMMFDSVCVIVTQECGTTSMWWTWRRDMWLLCANWRRSVALKYGPQPFFVFFFCPDCKFVYHFYQQSLWFLQ